jgi:hypothetical protein
VDFKEALMPLIHNNHWDFQKPDFFVESVMKNHPCPVTIFCVKDWGEGIWAAAESPNLNLPKEEILFSVTTSPDSTPESVLLSLETLFLAESLRNPEFQAWLDTKWCEMFGNWNGEYEEI